MSASTVHSPAPTAPSTRTAPTSRTGATPVVLGGSRALLWLFGTALFGVVLYYFIGIDQGATSVFGDNMYIHEFVHDARHLIGFPCH
ncbi:CbtB domain-containing protein [Actinomadura rupiterrae]|uniref:CbtB domain-containing protein n=1 Tax=Actinomadura rupiterrae TaxID=559627 RepID=UPI0020A5E4D9|nr:CbtB domain-containing protein [Actinomadura rupiterrae]MCP2336048.1 hypothetical protein [Actinomadura rupiterrae]